MSKKYNGQVHAVVRLKQRREMCGKNKKRYQKLKYPSAGLRGVDEKLDLENFHTPKSVHFILAVIGG